MDPNNLTNPLATILLESFGIEPKGRGRVYQKPYPDYYDQLPYPRGYIVPEFAKFSGEDGKTTLEHASHFILQCGEASANNVLKLRMFPLSLFGTAFTWFTSLAPNSIFTWAQLEQKFQEYFYFGDIELRMSHLTTIKQNHTEPAADYIRRFRDTRNQCFKLNISDKDHVDLAYSRLSVHLNEKLESHVFSCKSRAKKSRCFPRISDKPRIERHVNTVEYSSDSSDDEEADMCVAEWSWGSKSEPVICSSLKPAYKRRQDEMHCTFNKLNCQVIMLYHCQNSSKSMHIVNGIILICLLVMIAMFFVDIFNRP
jgi:hypothetical protein